MSKKCRIFLMVMFLVIVWGSFSYADDQSQQLVSEGRSLLFNNGEPTYSGIEQANEKFDQAVQADPSDQEANFFYAVTRVAVFVLKEGSGSGLETIADVLEAFGISRSGNDSIDDSPFSDPPMKLGHYDPPATVPGGEDLRSFLVDHFIPLLDDALANLSVITNSFNITLTAQETGDTAIEVDYGDVLVYKCFLYSLKGIAYFIAAYNLDVDLRDLLVKANMDVLQLQRDLLDEYSNVFHLRTSDGQANLDASKTAFINAIDAYNDAYNFIDSETDNQDDDLFFFDNDEEREDAQNFGNTLNDVKTSLQNNTSVDLDNDPDDEFYVDFNYVFGNTGKASLDIRNILPSLDSEDDIIAHTWPSPILNNIFPDINTEQDLIDAFNPQMVYDIPSASITLDGQGTDWSSIDTLIQDDTDNEISGGLDIELFKVARDSDSLYWMMTLRSGSAADNVVYVGDFGLGDYFNIWKYKEYDSEVWKDTNGKHYSLLSVYRGQSTPIIQDPSYAGISTVVEAKLPLDLFEGHVKAVVRGRTVFPYEIDTTEDQEPLIKLPTSFISGTITCPDHNGTGHIFVLVYNGPDPSSAKLLGSAVLDSPGSYSVADLPIGTDVYVLVIWDADDNGILTEGDYQVEISGPHAVSSGGTGGIDFLINDANLVHAQPIWVSVQRIINPDGSISTQFEMQGDVEYDEITVIDPTGKPILCRSDFQYYLWMGTSPLYYAIIPGSPSLGGYTFLAVDGLTLYKGTDLQYINRDIPIADETQFSPAEGSVLTSKTPSFSWQLVDYPEKSLFYRIYIKDAFNNFVYASDRVLDMTSITIPAGVLQPGQTYSYRVSIFDDSDYTLTQNRSNSQWVTFQMADTLNHASKPAIDPDTWGAVTWSSAGGEGVLGCVKIVDYDGVAVDGSSHQVFVTIPSDPDHPRQLGYDISAGAYAAYYCYYSGDPGDWVSGDYTFTVYDPDGNTSTFTEHLDVNTTLDPIDESSISPSIKSESITATFDDIYVNGSLYEDFNSYSDINELDSSKWLSVYNEGGQASIISDGSGKKLQLTAGNTVGKSESTVYFADPESINSIQATVTVTGATSTNVPRARIAGHWFNNGNGDVWADISVWSDRVTYCLVEDMGHEKTARYNILVPNTLLRNLSVGETVVVSISYDPSTATLTFDAGNGATATYSNQTGVAFPPISNFKRIQVRNNLVVSGSPTFSWAPVAGANRYRVKIYNAYGKTDKNVVLRGYTGTNWYRVPPGILEPNGVYHFRLDAFDSHSALDIQHASVTSIYTFFTSPEEPEDPYIDLDSSGVQTWNGNIINPHLNFWVKVYDAQGVPSDIKSVKVTTPSHGDVLLEYYPDFPGNSDVCGVFTRDSFFPVESGTYTFTVEDKEGNTYQVSEYLNVNPIGYPDPSTLTPVTNTVVNDTPVDFDWDDVNGSAFYRLELYDKDYNRVYAFTTTDSNYQLQPGFLKPGELYRYCITTRREFFDENVDNGSSSPWGYRNLPTIINRPITGGTDVPTIELKNWGVVVSSVPDPASGTKFYWLDFQVKVTDQDGVPANIKSVRVTFPGGSRTIDLYYDESSFGQADHNYMADELYANINDIPEGVYTFTVTDMDGNTAQVTDTLSLNPIDFPTAWWPTEGSEVSTTTPVLEWSDVLGASRYRVRIYDGWNHTLHWSPFLSTSSYQVPSGLLEYGKMYSYRVYSYRETYPDQELDSCSVNTFGFSNSAHFTVKTGIIDSDGDGLSDALENSMCTSALDADTDDDGIPDGIEDANHNGVVDAGETDPCNIDTDGDGIQDGTELGYTLATASPATDLTVFQPDLDPDTTTDPLDADTDNDGLTDGQEDKNANGRRDPGERDPNAATPRAMPWIPLLLGE